RPEGARDVGPAPLGLVYLAGIYGGDFGAAQGVCLLALLAVFVPDALRRSNALKNVLAGTVNAVAAVVFVLFADVAWGAAGEGAPGGVRRGAPSGPPGPPP